jgi:hypothetical protein
MTATTTMSTASSMEESAPTSSTSDTTVATTKNTHLVLPAVRGGRCAVFFAKGNDVFGTCRPAAGGWYPATIVKVTRTAASRNSRNSSKLNVRFDDGTLGNYTYPSKEVQLLSSNPPNNGGNDDDDDSNTNTNNNILYGEDGQVMYTSRPTKLQVGDLVFGYFQQGQGGISDEWYRGRVVATRRLEDFPVVDIAYDDGDFESNVPFTTGVVLKQADGWHFPEWMVGLAVHIPPKRKTFHAITGEAVKSGVVKEAKPHGAVWIEYDTGSTSSDSNSSTFTEKRAYLMVAQRLLLHAKEHFMDPKRSFEWPYNMLVPSPKAKQKMRYQQQEVIEIIDVEQENHNNNNKKAASAAVDLPPPKKKMRATARTAAPSVADQMLATRLPQEHQQQPSATAATSSSNKPPTGRKRAPAARGQQGQTLTAPRRAPSRSKATATSPTMDSPTIGGQRVQRDTSELFHCTVECVAESDWSDSDASEGEASSQQLPDASSSSNNNTRPNSIKEIQASLGSSLVASVNSTDPHLGAETLMFLAVHHKQMPGPRVRQSLIALLTHGPMSGKTPFDDCHRMTLVEQYVSHCLAARRPDMANSFAVDAGASYWSDCLTNLTALYYCAYGDEDRTSGFAIDRVAQTVFAKTCCANLFLKLLSSQLQPFMVVEKKKGKISREQLLTLPIVKDIAAHRRGAKEALEMSARAYAELCITLGHFDQGQVAGLLLDDESEDVQGDTDVVGPSDQSIRFVCMHSRRLLQTVGKITSILAWLYGYQANENAKSVGRLLRNICQRAFEDKQFDPSPFLGGKNDEVPLVSIDKHWSLVKLHLILNLDKRAIPGVRPMLAETLGVGLQYNAIFG